MKRKSLLSIALFGLCMLALQSCKNQDVDFPDYDNSAVYFAYQYPVRTLVMGDDVYDTSLDNAHKCKIYAVLSGVYSNGGTVAIDFAVDNTLCNNLYYSDGSAVKPMPSAYYSVASNQIILDKSMSDGVEIQFADAFFNDENALKNTYVIPLRMTKVTNADSILQGKAKATSTNPVRCNASDWDVAPKDYVLYCVKFINTWAGNYLRRGVDVVTENGATTTTVRHNKNVENDQIFKLTTKNLKSALYPFDDNCKLILTFKDDNTCTVTSDAAGYTVTGTGSFVKSGEKNSWGNKDRDAIYLNYQVTVNGKTTATKDTLVARDRGVSIETFTPVYRTN